MAMATQEVNALLYPLQIHDFHKLIILETNQKTLHFVKKINSVTEDMFVHLFAHVPLSELSRS